jgi:hypothetical protein
MSSTQCWDLFVKLSQGHLQRIESMCISARRRAGGSHLVQGFGHSGRIARDETNRFDAAARRSASNLVGHPGNAGAGGAG